MIELPAAAWVVLAVGALLVGIAKTALPGLATLAVAGYATVLPARESTAVLLVLLLTGDLVAIWAYRRDCDFTTLRRLVPTVLVGVVAGAAFLAFADNTTMRRTIGVILLALTALTLWGMRRGLDSAAAQGPWAQAGYGALGGFTTMAANSGGPVMTLYFLTARFDMMRFLGTQAWFFFLVNIAKLPFSVGLGLLSTDMLPLLLLVPVTLSGVWLGRVTVRRLDQTWFNRIIIALTIVSSLYLLR